MLQVIKKKNKWFDIFKLNDEDRIKEFQIKLNLTYDNAKRFNETFNIYINTYFDRTKILNFYYNPPKNIDDIIYSIIKICPKIKLIVNDFPSLRNVLINIRTPVDIIMVTVSEDQTEFHGTGEYYLLGAEYRGTIVEYDDETQFWEDVMNIIKYEDLRQYHKYQVRLRDILNNPVVESPIIPNKITRTFTIPSSMLIKVNEKLISVQDATAFIDFIDPLMLEFVEFSDEILENEIAQTEDMALMDKIKQIINMGIYLDLDRLDIYALVSKIVYISELNKGADSNEEIQRNLAVIAYLIYLHIHDDIIHINPENTFVSSFTSTESGLSLVDYYIIFMVQIFKSLFNVNYVKYIKDIKRTYGTFIQISREKLKFKMTHNSLILPMDSCGNYISRIIYDLGKVYDADLYKQVENIISAGLNAKYQMRDQTPSFTRKAINYILKPIPRFRYTRSKEFVITLPATEHSLDEKSVKVSEVTSLNYGISETKLLKSVIGDGTSLDLVDFGLMKRRMDREKKYAPSEYNERMYYRNGFNFIKTSATEFVQKYKLKPYGTFFKTVDNIEKIGNEKLALDTLRGYFYSILIGSGVDRDSILKFLIEQHEFYMKFDLLDYDLEYKKQKKLEQYEKRNQIYYNLTPEEKMFLGLDKLTGEDRTAILDQLVLEKFGS